MERHLQNIFPRSLDQVLEAYVKTWEAARKGRHSETPLMSLYLAQGEKISGEVIHIDFEEQLFCLRVGETNHLDVLYVAFSQVKAFVLHRLESCDIFLAELAQM